MVSLGSLEIAVLVISILVKYKTELCRNFAASGSCSYASRCQFAHGLHELRGRTRHPKYKTEFCRNFFSGYCKYGSRCQFVHHSSNDTKDNSDLCSNERTAVPYAGITFLAVFSSLPCTSNPVATIGTCLLTNVLAQSSMLGLGGSMLHQSALAVLAACAHLQSTSHCSILPSTTTTPVRNEIALHKTSLPFYCGIDMS